MRIVTGLIALLCLILVGALWIKQRTTPVLLLGRGLDTPGTKAHGDFITPKSDTLRTYSMPSGVLTALRGTVTLTADTLELADSLLPRSGTHLVVGAGYGHFQVKIATVSGVGRNATGKWTKKISLVRDFQIPLWCIALVCLGVLILPSSTVYVRRRRRSRLGHCLECGFNLRGTMDSLCPECGSVQPIAVRIAGNPSRPTGSDFQDRMHPDQS